MVAIRVSESITATEMNPETEILHANAAFTKNLYEILARKKGNIFFSPISVHAVLSMLYQGAEGNTHQILAHTLKNPDAKSTAEGYRAAITRLNSIKQITLLMANKIYGVQDKMKFLDVFKDCIVKNFDGEVELLDLVDPKKAAKSVNGWVEEKTCKNIKNIVNEAIFTKTLSMVVVNAIYFKGEWVSKFKETATKPDKFKLNEKNTVDVKMMCQKGNYYYKEDDELGAQIIEMPYKGYDVKMIIILPTDDNLDKLEKKLTQSDLSHIGKDLKLTDIQLFLPKFKMEETLKLNDVLSEMGLKPIFDPKEANFKGIFDVSSLQDNLCVSQVFQKTYIEVNEGGTVAAAATKAAMVLGSAPGKPKTVVFRVDHPAIFLLVATHGKEKDLSNILFYGRLCQPEY